MKKILIFIPSLAGGGAERTLVNIIKYIDKKRFTVTLVMVRDVTKEYQKNKYLNLIKGKCKIVYLDSKLSGRFLFDIIYKLSKCIKIEKPDILFSTRYISNIILYFAKVISRENIPLVLRESTNRTEEGISKIIKLLIKVTYKRASRVVALSKGVAQDLIENFKIPQENIEVIYNPVDIKEIERLKLEKLEENIMTSNEKLIISVGRLFEQKDFPTLLKAFKIVSDEINSKLIILGQGPLKNKLIELAKELGIEERVYMLGFKDNPYPYINRADLFVLSSKFEGFGHVIVEALTIGTPVISSNCKSGPEEILEYGEYGKLFQVGNYKELSNKICEMLKNERLLQDFKTKGKQRAKKFDATEIVKQYENLFSKLSS